MVLLGSVAPAVAAQAARLDDAPLRAVRYADAREGWAVGDHGLVWHTMDGGTTWERQPTGTTASLRAVHFVTPYAGWVVGRTELPNGAGSAGAVLFTNDGGATWRELGSGVLPGLNAVRFTDELNGTVSGDPTDVFPTGTFATADGGRTWRPVPAASEAKAVPKDAAWAFDERAACRAGSHVWAVGRPGSVVFHSADGGKTWATQRTHTPTPLHGVHFADEKVGCAVGDLGTILGTTDGGATWTVRKAGGQRAAVLMLHARAEAVPLGAVAVLGAKDGYLVATETVGGDNRLPAAVRMAGGVGGDPHGPPHFPAYLTERPADTDPGMLPTARDEAMLARLVLAIRSWRPEVVVTDALSADAPLCDQQVLLDAKDAFTLAADPKAFPEQLDRLGLAPHAPKKLYALAADEGAAVALDLTTFVPDLGGAVRDSVEPAALVLGSANPDRVRFRLVSHRLPGAEEHTALMQGIDLAPGGPSRRPAAEVDTLATADREKVTQTRRRLEAVLDKPETVGGWEPALGQVLGSLKSLPDDAAARTAVSLGLRLADAGHWTAARELLAAVAERYPAYPEAVEAARWLVRYHASGEVQRRIELGHFPVFQKAAFVAVDAAGPGVRPASHSEPSVFARPAFRFSGPEAAQRWQQYALDLEPALAAFGGVYARDPRSQLPLNAARRRLGLLADATKVVKALTPVGADTPTARRMADELRLLTGTAGGDPNRPWAACPTAESKPFLDGKLEDACWKEATLAIDPAGADHPTEVRFARDAEFLYVAVACRHLNGKPAPKAEKRSRDADLRGRDRVEVRLDLDRDGESFYRLRVDHRGQVAEDCGGDAGWNPRWFVAVEPTLIGWTAELAIPLAELTGTPPAAKDVWSVDVTRVVPGVGEAATGWRPLAFK